MNSTIIRCRKCGTKNRIPAGKEEQRPKCGRCGELIDVHDMGSVRELTDASFDTVIRNSAVPVMVDFYSPTCGPCQTLAPTVVSLARKFSGRVLVARIDTSRYQLAAGRFQIRGVPTLIFFRQGKVVDQIVGAVSYAQLEQKLNTMA